MRKISSQTPLQQRISSGYPQDLLARTSTKSGIFEDLDRIPTRSPSKNLIQQDCPTAPNCRRAQRAQPSRRPWPIYYKSLRRPSRWKRPGEKRSQVRQNEKSMEITARVQSCQNRSKFPTFIFATLQRMASKKCFHSLAWLGAWGMPAAYRGFSLHTSLSAQYPHRKGKRNERKAMTCARCKHVSMGINQPSFR